MQCASRAETIVLNGTRRTAEQVSDNAGIEVKSVFGAALNWVVIRDLRGPAGSLQLQADAVVDYCKFDIRSLQLCMIAYFSRFRLGLVDVSVVWSVTHPLQHSETDDQPVPCVTTVSCWNPRLKMRSKLGK